jgi:hypothetical protein
MLKDPQSTTGTDRRILHHAEEREWGFHKSETEKYGTQELKKRKRPEG